MATGEGSEGAGSSGGLFGGFIGGAVAAAQNAVAELYTELESFTKFRDRIDEILVDLKASPADAKKLGEISIKDSQFGDVSWPEAKGMFASYEKVVGELETLSKLLSDSIEGMSIAVLASHKGYDNMDQDIRERMLAIKTGAEKHYPGEYNPVPGGDKQSGNGDKTPPTPQPSTTDDTGGA
ncbi:hypothetical protein OG554_14470 [Streptomyces griseus]|uniref:hypothetical protein n=1 Tax=Streptomyces griseus TaxID=1911 RepID=UPI0037A97774|nr:hypothetical protein OG554_14470 [Streptomyces fimicarius]